MRRFLISFIIFQFLGLSCLGEKLKNGDLIFICEGSGDFSEAITIATAYEDSIKFVHVGIIEIENDAVYVVEASPEEGVRKIDIFSFLGEMCDDNICNQYVIKRLNIDFPVDPVIERAHGYLGRPYDWTFMPGDEELYCSELVYECYVDADGSHIFKSQPMNFRMPDGRMPQFWIDLYSKIGCEIPEGLPGTNPNDLSKDPKLKTITFDWKDLID